MRIVLAGLIAAVVLSLFGTAALQAAGDDWPGGSEIPSVLQTAGDDWPGGS